jgi:hypothetical protein
MSLVPGNKRLSPYSFELVFLAILVPVSIAGFWEIFFGVRADPNRYHLLHLVTNFAWLGLLLYQLNLLRTRRNELHRKAGISVLAFAPLLVASTALLSVHSAQKGLASGEGDRLLIQNVGVTLELALLILLAFVFRKRRKLHGSFLLSTGVLFLGIALFFTLLSFVPTLKIEGPESFGNFATAGITAQGTCLLVGVIFVIRDWRNGWPMLLAAIALLLNEVIRGLLAARGLIEPLTRVVGSMSEPLTFVGTFALFAAVLAATGIRPVKAPAGAPELS